MSPGPDPPFTQGAGVGPVSRDPTRARPRPPDSPPHSIPTAPQSLCLWEAAAAPALSGHSWRCPPHCTLAFTRPFHLCMALHSVHGHSHVPSTPAWHDSVHGHSHTPPTTAWYSSVHRHSHVPSTPAWHTSVHGHSHTPPTTAWHASVHGHSHVPSTSAWHSTVYTGIHTPSTAAWSPR